MTPAYPATLTFPTAALELVPIREWIQCPDAGAMAGYAQWLHERESQAEPLFAAASTWRPAPADRPSDHSRTGVADAVMRAIFR